MHHTSKSQFFLLSLVSGKNFAQSIKRETNILPFPVNSHIFFFVNWTVRNDGFINPDKVVCNVGSKHSFELGHVGYHYHIAHWNRRPRHRDAHEMAAIGFVV
jgi:hypothetical protein